jgi:hypothetical protein
MSEPLTSIWFFNEHNLGHMNLTLDRHIQKYTSLKWLYVQTVWKAVLYQSGLSTTFQTGEIIDDKHPLRL